MPIKHNTCNIHIIRLTRVTRIKHTNLVICFRQDGWTRLDPRLFTSLTTKKPRLYVIPVENILGKLPLVPVGDTGTTCATCFLARRATAGRVLMISSSGGKWMWTCVNHVNFFWTRKSDIHRLNKEGGARNELVKISCVPGALCENSSESPRYGCLHMDGKSLNKADFGLSCIIFGLHRVWLSWKSLFKRCKFIKE